MVQQQESVFSCIGNITLKLLLMIFNILFALIGLSFLIVGVVGMNTFKEFFKFAPSVTIYVPLVVAGSFMILVGMMAMCCTPKGNACLLYLYAAIVFLFFMTIFSVSLAFAISRSSLEKELKVGIEEAMFNYDKDVSSRESMNALQLNIQCCGTTRFVDWFNTTFANGVQTVPDSCCKVSGCKRNNMEAADTTGINEEGCYKFLHDRIESNYGTIAGVGFVSSFIIFLGAVLACMIGCNSRHSSYRYDRLDYKKSGRSREEQTKRFLDTDL